MKSELIAGDTLDFTTSVPLYPPSDGWTLTYKLIPRSTGTVISFDAAVEGTDYRVQIGPSTTVDWVAGEYSWVAYVHQTGERYTVDKGLVLIKPDPGVVTAYDGRSHARKTLDAIEAVIEGRASLDQQEYTIGNRNLKRIPVAELIKFRQIYRAEVQAEINAENIANGQGRGNKVVYRL